jgi:hypothetical protein
MFTSPYKLLLAIIAMAVVASNAWAGNATIEGTVLDQKGKPLKGADVRVEHSGGSAWKQAAKTDAKGLYLVGSLDPDQTYRVTLLVNNQVKASINNVRTRTALPVSMNFDLSKDKTAATGQSLPATKKKTHKVWVASETGSNLGGRWVEEQEGGNDAGANNVKKASGDAVRGMQMGSR